MNIPAFLTDLEINFSPVPAELSNATSKGVLWQTAPESFLLDIPDVARYLVENGCRVAIDMAEAADSAKVERFFRMAPFAALLYQRGMLVLHASAIAIKHGALLIAGDSGAGKSTLIAKLLQRGGEMLSDDLSVVALDAARRPVVWPTWPEVALWPAAFELLGLDGTNHPMFDSNRRALSFPDRLALKPVPLKALYKLSVTKEAGIEITDISGASKFSALASLSFNTHIADAIIDRADFMLTAVAMFSSAKFYYLKRSSKTSLDDLADAVLKEF